MNIQHLSRNIHDSEKYQKCIVLLRTEEIFLKMSSFVARFKHCKVVISCNCTLVPPTACFVRTGLMQPGACVIT